MFSFMEFGNPLQDSCDLIGFSVGMTAPAHGGHGGFHRRAQMHDLTASKAPDYLTGVLVQYCGAGKHIDAVALKVYRSEDSEAPYLTYILKDVLIASIYGAGQSDQFTLNAKSTTVKYQGQVLEM